MISTTALILSISIFIGGIIVAIIGYFLKKQIDEFKETKMELKDNIKVSTVLRKDLDVLTRDHENKHESMTEKLDDLKDVIVVLTSEIKQLTAKIK